MKTPQPLLPPNSPNIYPQFDQPTLAHQGTQCYFPTFVGLAGGMELHDFREALCVEAFPISLCTFSSICQGS